MNYPGVELLDSIHIDRIYSIHYFEYSHDFTFPGESHDFWEFICVDKGEAGITGGQTSTILSKNQIAFHAPGEFHSVAATGNSAPNLVVISFACPDPAMDFFQGRIGLIDEFERSLLANIIIEARQCFSGPLDDPYASNLVPKPTDTFASQQMIRLLLEQFLIHLYRRYSRPILSAKALSTAPLKMCRKKGDAEIFKRVTHYMANNLDHRLYIDQICLDNLVGRTQLQKIFREQCGFGIIEYFARMKIEASKELIRSGNLNFTQVSAQLGYSSIHYFSRQFKKIAGMTPTEYASSIKAMTDRHNL